MQVKKNRPIASGKVAFTEEQLFILRNLMQPITVNKDSSHADFVWHQCQVETRARLENSILT